MTGYKIAAYYDKEEHLWKPCMVTLEIPDDAQVVCPYEYEYDSDIQIKVDHKFPYKPKRYSKKLRCNKAEVVSIVDTSSDKSSSEAISIYLIDSVIRYPITYTYSELMELFEIRNTALRGGIYRVGDAVEPDYFDSNRDIVCSNGIHFFSDKESALYFMTSCGRLGISWVTGVIRTANYITSK